jgi:hypothetical protein
VKQAGKVDPDGKALTSVLRVTELFVDVQVRAQRTSHAACLPLCQAAAGLCLLAITIQGHQLLSLDWLV